MAKKKVITGQEILDNAERAERDLETTAGILQREMESNSNVSLRALATHHEISYPRLLKASRSPQAGVPYDPEAINWQALAKVLGIDKVLDTPWVTLNAPREGAVRVEKDIAQFEVGQQYWLRRSNEAPFTIIHKTATHIVLQQVDTETPFCWSHSTFMLNGPSKERRVATAAVEKEVK